jgi:hypothetical protein
VSAKPASECPRGPCFGGTDRGGALASVQAARDQLRRPMARTDALQQWLTRQRQKARRPEGAGRLGLGKGDRLQPQSLRITRALHRRWRAAGSTTHNRVEKLADCYRSADRLGLLEPDAWRHVRLACVALDLVASTTFRRTSIRSFTDGHEQPPAGERGESTGGRRGGGEVDLRPKVSVPPRAKQTVADAAR